MPIEYALALATNLAVDDVLSTVALIMEIQAEVIVGPQQERYFLEDTLIEGRRAPKVVQDMFQEELGMDITMQIFFPRDPSLTLETDMRPVVEGVVKLMHMIYCDLTFEYNGVFLFYRKSGNLIVTSKERFLPILAGLLPKPYEIANLSQFFN